jgi:hypothetical protein
VKPTFTNLNTADQVITTYQFLRITKEQLPKKGQLLTFDHPAERVQIKITRSTSKSTYDKPLYKCEHFRVDVPKNSRRFYVALSHGEQNREHTEQVIDCDSPATAAVTFCAKLLYEPLLPLRNEQPTRTAGYLYSVWSVATMSTGQRVWIKEAIGE